MPGHKTLRDFSRSAITSGSDGGTIFHALGTNRGVVGVTIFRKPRRAQGLAQRSQSLTSS